MCLRILQNAPLENLHTSRSHGAWRNAVNDAGSQDDYGHSHYRQDDDESFHEMRAMTANDQS
jgi:hypothetical protein